MAQLPYALAVIGIALASVRAFQMFRGAVDVMALSRFVVMQIESDQFERLSKLLRAVAHSPFAKMIQATLRVFDAETPTEDPLALRANLHTAFHDTRTEQLMLLGQGNWTMWTGALCAGAALVVGWDSHGGLALYGIVAGALLLVAWSMFQQYQLIRNSTAAGELLVSTLVQSAERTLDPTSSSDASGDDADDTPAPTPVARDTRRRKSDALVFEIHEPDRDPHQVAIERKIVKIGKLQSSHLRCVDDSMSRMHAVIEVEDGDVLIIDLGSTRGTFVNGKRVNKGPLHAGDQLQLGDTRIVFLGIDGAETDSPPVPSPNSDEPDSDELDSDELSVIPAPLAPMARVAGAQALASPSRDASSRLNDLRTQSCPVCDHATICKSGPLYAQQSARLSITTDLIGPFTVYVCSGCGYSQWFANLVSHNALRPRDKQSEGNMSGENNDSETNV